MTDKLPGARAALVDNAGVTTPPFYRYFQALERLQAGTASAADIAAINAQIAAIQAEITALPKASYPTLQVSAPITSAGLLQNGFAKLGLATLDDSGAGTFKLITRDSFGRVSGTKDGTTSDVSEGTNLYHTAARVLATVLAGLSTATNAAITAADTVLSALGKLQAQITANIATLAGKLTASNNLSDVANGATAFNNLRALFSNVYVTNSVNQNIATLGTAQQISFNNVDTDTQGEYSASINEITISHSGTYLVFGYGHVEQLTSGAYVAVSVYINGADTARLGEQIFAASSGGIGMGGCVVLNLTAGNTISLWIRVTAGSSPYIDGIPSVCNFGALRIQ